MERTRTHIVLSSDLIAGLDKLVGKRGRSRLINEVLSRELLRLEQLESFQRAVGAWKDKAHPEWKRGSATWVRRLRKESERRAPKVHLRK